MARLQRVALPSANQLLAQLFENPNLITAVRELPGPILGKLILSVGLEDAAELVALATTQQLESVFDEDLWEAGSDGWEERFNPERFALWLHAFSEAGDQAVVKRLIELPIDFVILAVHRLILVIDIDALAMEMSESNGILDQLEKALESRLYEEWEEFRLIARDDTAWDEIIQALFSLDRDHHGLLRKILERCSALSSEWIDDNGGLYAVLSSDEMLESDMRAERDDRRAQKGYVSPADARAFLELASQGVADPASRDAITNAYFRNLTRQGSTPAVPKLAKVTRRSANVGRLLHLLESANVIETPGRESLAKASRQPRTRQESTAVTCPTVAQNRLLDRALAELRGTDPEGYAERMEELGYLANVLIAAPQNRHRRLRPVEALESALECTDRGLELTLSAIDRNSAETELHAATALLGKTTADRLFRVGFADGRSRARGK